MRQRLGAIMVVAITAPAGGSDLIVNGDFEQGPSMPMCNWVAVTSGSSTIPGWTVVGGSVDYARWSTGCNPALPIALIDGEHFIDLDGTLSSGAIRQTVNLVAGRRYVLSFLMSGNDHCGSSIKRLRLLVGSSVRIFEYACSAAALEEFQARSMSFEATAGLTTIEFQSLDGSGCGPVIDRVTLSPDCPADVIQNGVVDAIDLSAVLSSWGTDGGKYPRADVDANGDVDAIDLAMVLSSWGACP